MRWTNRLSGSVDRADKANASKLRAALSRLMLIEYTFRLEQAATLGDEESLGLFSSIPLELKVHSRLLS
jgi:hypothetical protein